MKKDDELLRVGEVAKRLGVDRQTVHRWSKQGHIAVARRHPLNGYLLFEREAIDALKEKLGELAI